MRSLPCLTDSAVVSLTVYLAASGLLRSPKLITLALPVFRKYE